MLDTLLLTRRGHRRLAIALKPIRVRSQWGLGELIYETDDGFCGVRLDGETRTDEYPAHLIEVA